MKVLLKHHLAEAVVADARGVDLAATPYRMVELEGADMLEAYDNLLYAVEAGNRSRNTKGPGGGPVHEMIHTPAIGLVIVTYGACDPLPSGDIRNRRKSDDWRRRGFERGRILRVRALARLVLATPRD